MDRTAKDALFCRMYVDANLDPEGMVEAVHGTIGGMKRDATIMTRDTTVHVRVNKDNDVDVREKEPDNFLYFAYSFEIEPSDYADRAPYLKRVADLVKGLWDQGHRAVASCDFEDELPWGGGIQRLRGVK